NYFRQTENPYSIDFLLKIDFTYTDLAIIHRFKTSRQEYSRPLSRDSHSTLASHNREKSLLASKSYCKLPSEARRAK
ncbi:MAG: hypothetical protein ABGX43_08290, partial [Nitrospinaceae bacterium]